MKKAFILLVAMMMNTLVFAQVTNIFSKPQELFNEGISLYQQQQYSASYRTLSEYTRLSRENAQAAQFYLVADMFELRDNSVLVALKNYLKQFPFTVYADEIHFMMGVTYAEKTKYKLALKDFEKVDPQHLSRDHQTAFLFYRGYSHLQQGENQKAALYFDKLRKQNTIYNQQANYYYAYCNYTMQNYGKALPAFLAIENSELYQDIVPYYVIQIYYAQQQYDEVFSRADYLLSNKTNNSNNAELHRMVGEIYYQEAEYEKAIPHFLEYEKSDKDALLRNDIYLLGMSYYQTEDYANAAKYLSRVKQTTDTLSQNTCLHLGNAYVKLNQTEQAKLAYRAAAQIDANDTIREEALFNYAITTYNSSSALGESITAFNDFIQQYPNSKHKNEVYSLLCDVFMSSKNYTAAYDALVAMNSSDPKMLETKEYLIYQMGTDEFVQNKTEAAIGHFSDVINGMRLNKTYLMESYFWRAECYYRLRDYDRAYSDLLSYMSQPNVAKSPNYEMSNYSMGYCLFSQKKYANAKTYFEKYTKTADQSLSTYSDALNRIGDCYFNDRDFVKAESIYAKVIALGSVGADYATFQRGYALGLLKRYGDKVSTLDQLVSRYPKSDYADDALYEIARAELQRDNTFAAINSYERLLANYPNSTYASKAMLEKGMLQYNSGDYNSAIASYKQVVSQYSGSDEAYSALEGLEAIYIEINKVDEYFAYVKTLGRSDMKVDTREDSLTYMAAERQYMLGNYAQAASGLKSYVNKYCMGGRYCSMAQYYLADSYYRQDKMTDAKNAFIALAQADGNPYIEEACMRVAEISYDEQDYTTSLKYFEKMQKVASTTDNNNTARLGVLRCSYLLDDHATTIRIATEMIADKATPADVVSEAKYNRGKAYYQLGKYDLALTDLQDIAKNVQTANGAESKYLVAEIYLRLNELDKSENEVMDFAGKNTSYQFWLAKSFIVLSDVYAARGETFQAEQYLLSLQANYKADDEIQMLINDRLAKLYAPNEMTNNEIDDEDDEE